MRFWFIVLGIAAVAGAFLLMMHIKTDVQILARERDHLEEEQAKLKENLRVLQAEYALLSDPDQLAAQAGKMGFTEMKPARMVGMNQDIRMDNGQMVPARWQPEQPEREE